MDSPSDDTETPKNTQLKQLLRDDDDGTESNQNDDDMNKMDESDLLLNDDSALEETELGDAIDSLMLSWSQMLTTTAARHTPQPPTMDHVKETAEVYVKHFRDACHDVNAELAKIALQWRMEHTDETLEEQTKDLSEAICRQKTLLGRAPGVLSRRTEEYFNNPK